MYELRCLLSDEFQKNHLILVVLLFPSVSHNLQVYQDINEFKGLFCCPTLIQIGCSGEIAQTA